MAVVTDVLYGAITKGVNLPTYVLLNIVIGAAFVSLLLLLATSIFYNPALVPHVIVLLVLATGLWISINWFIANVGLVDASSQKAQLFGSAEGNTEGQEGREGREQQTAPAAPKKEL